MSKFEDVINYIDNLTDGFGNHLLKELVMNCDDVEDYIYENYYLD